MSLYDVAGQGYLKESVSQVCSLSFRDGDVLGLPNSKFSEKMAFEYNCLSLFESETQTSLLQSIPCGREQVTVFASYVKKKLVSRTFTMKIKAKNEDKLYNTCRLVSSFSACLFNVSLLVSYW